MGNVQEKSRGDFRGIASVLIYNVFISCSFWFARIKMASPLFFLISIVIVCIPVIVYILRKRKFFYLFHYSSFSTNYLNGNSRPFRNKVGNKRIAKSRNFAELSKGFQRYFPHLVANRLKLQEKNPRSEERGFLVTHRRFERRTP